ncbi:hypothetical protein DRP53_10715 [candidate division WOR-3 bacterium]|uniref:DUF362 domain-containing protein n=1 Tax=candidate division WOR-3 bacterium TaxID=2052148 RepID=A0A660SCE7_UNCW3|nr:MAG: hypothetical protein DRP53_10715 [candidate division WOR-3 bacterium]
MMEKISRRDFLKRVALSGMALPLFSRSLFRIFNQKSIVVIVKDEYSTSGSNINQAVVQIMIDAGIKELTGINNVGDAWKSLFPNLTSSDIISIKINCINSNLPSHPEVTESVIEGLAQMNIGGSNYIKNNVIVWDRSDSALRGCGYTIYTGNEPNRYRCFGTTHSGVGYDYNTPLNVNGVTSHPSRILSQFNRYLIDLSCLKTHSTAIVTLNLKNHYGSIDNPGSLHGNHCDPYIPSLNAEIRDKLSDPQRFFIIDGLFGICLNWGPGGSPDSNPQLIIMSKDPVACDWNGQDRINAIRVENGYPKIDASHIHTAAQAPYNLGTDDPEEMDIRWIINPSVRVKEKEADGVAILTIRPNPFQNHAEIRIGLAHRSFTQLNLYNTIGQRVRELYSGYLTRGEHTFRIDGQRLKSGVYYLYLRTPTTTLRRKLILSR